MVRKIDCNKCGISAPQQGAISIYFYRTSDIGAKQRANADLCASCHDELFSAMKIKPEWANRG